MASSSTDGLSMCSVSPSPSFLTVGRVRNENESLSAVWEIDDFSVSKGTIRSHPFDRNTCAGTSKWCMQLNTKMLKNDKEFVGVFIELVEKQPFCEYLVKCEFSFTDVEQSVPPYRFEFCYTFANVGKTYGFPNCISRSAVLSAFEKNRKLLIRTTFEVTQSKEICTIHEDMRRLLDLGERYSDFTLRNDDNEEIKVYKGLLALHSKVFDNMFQNKMKEAEENIATIPFSKEVMHQIVLFMYTGTLPAEISAKELFRAAHMYDIGGLKRLCLPRLLKDVNVENCCDILILSQMYNEKELKHKCLELVVKNAKSLQKTDGWKELFGKKENADLRDEVVLAIAEKSSV